MVQNLLLSGSRQFLLDTCAIIYFLTGLEPYLSVLLPLFRRIQRGEASLMVSVVTESELMVHPERDRDEEAIERIGDLLSEDGIYVVSMDRRIGRRAAKLRADNGLALPDAIIVATAIETGCDAIVTNDGKWRRVTEIPVVILDEVLTK